jgi:hypothetical protein
MVSSIHGTTGAGALGVDARYTQRPAQSAVEPREGASSPDRVELSAGSLAAARDSVREGIAHVQEALALGHEAMSLLLKAQSAARGEVSQDDLDATLKAYSDRLEAALARGTRLVTGADVTVQAEPGTAPVVIPGVDLRLKAEPGADDVISVAANTSVDDPALAQASQRSLERLQEAMGRLLESMRSLEAHQGFLGAVETAAGVRRDVDTDGARLLALQVRQGLEAAGASAIANVEPQAVLTLFRA